MKQRSVLALLLALILLFTGCADAVNAAYPAAVPAGIQPLKERTAPGNSVLAPGTAATVTEGGISYVNNELVLVLAADVPGTRAQALAGQYGFTVVGGIEAANTFQLRSETPRTLEDLETISERLSAEEGVLCAVPNYVRRLEPLALPEDDWAGDPLETGTAAGCNWGVEAINAVWLWERYPELASVRVGVIDTMFDVSHEDISFAQLLHGDVYYDTDKEAPEASHGTFMAGLLCAEQGNGKGGAGVLRNCELVGSALYGAPGGYTLLSELSLTAELLTYGIEVINFSLGYPAGFVSLLAGGDPAALRAYEEEIRLAGAALGNLLSFGWDWLLVCAAGNAGGDARYASAFAGIDDPAVAGRILVVGAAELTGESAYAFASWSNTGARVDVLAPGSGVLSCTDRNGYSKALRGTSVSAAFAAGACGVIRAMKPELDCAEIKKWIVGSADITVEGSEKKLIDLKSGVDPFYDGNGTAPGYVYSSSDSVRFFLFLCAENEKLDAGSTEYYVHTIAKTVTLGALAAQGISPDVYYAIVPLDGFGAPLRTDVIQILSCEKLVWGNAFRIRYRVLCSGDLVFDKVSEIRESVVGGDVWVWVLKEEVRSFGSSTINFDTDNDGICERPVRVVDLRSYFNNEDGTGSVRLVADFEWSDKYRGPITWWHDSSPSLLTVLEKIGKQKGNDAYVMFERYA